MNAERLLEVYEQISEAPDAIARLRRFALDLAVRGKLVDQDPTDAPASVLISEAKALKAREGVKEKPDPIEGSEMPFPVPVGWHWTRVGTIALQTGSGSTPRGGKSAYADKGTPFLRSQNIYDEGLRLDDVVFINDETNAKMKRTQVKAKDLLLNITGGSIGRCTRVPDDFLGANVSQHVAIIRTAATGTEDYLHLLVRSPFFQEYVIGEQTGAGRGGLPKNRMDRIPVPLPPLAEQHRIVAKVDELMALCDRLEEARKTREETRDKLTAASLARLTAPDTAAENFPAHANFALEALPALTTRPDQIKTLRQTILNLAVRGKLVEQDPADEPASALLEKIARTKFEEIRSGSRKKGRPVGDFKSSDIPFDQPNGWAFDFLQNVIDVRDGTHDTPPASDDANAVPLITSKDFKAGKIDFQHSKRISLADHTEISKRSAVEVGDILFSMIGGNIGNQVMVNDPRPFSIKNVALFKYYDTSATLPNFVKIYMEDLANRLQNEASGGAQPFVSLGALRKLPIGLPPVAEQHRIVAKIDALMVLCDRLEAALTTTDTTRTRLLEALLHEALEPSHPKDEIAA